MTAVSFNASSSTPLKIACIGEAMIELSFSAGDTSQAAIGFAGDTLNTAIYLNREISKSHEVSFVSRIGIDTFSKQMRDFIADEGVCVNSLTSDEKKIPGLYSISTDDNGERSFNYWRNDSAARLLFQNNGIADFSGLEKFNVLYLSGITLAILPDFVRKAFFSWLPCFRSRDNTLVVFDSNFRPKLWQDRATAQHCIESMWRLTDIGLPSVDDEMLLFDDKDEDAVIRRFKGYGIKTGVLKRGESGPLNITEEQRNFNFPAADHMLDSTAAGDSFNGAFLASLLGGSDVDEAMLAGHNCACRVIAHRGAIIPR